MSEAADPASVARSFFDAVGRRDIEAMIEHYQPGATGEIHGLIELAVPDTYRAWFENLFEAFPDFKFEVLDLVADDDKAAVRWRATGHFTGPVRFEGLIANGAKVEVQGCDVLAIRDGHIQRNDAYMNAAEMARQLGVLPAQGSAPEKALTGALNMKTQIMCWVESRRA
jgi:steroid delta-isomerase-like uncharacterized protein